jgi:hypothetical protein
LKHKQIQNIGGKLIKDMRTVIFVLLMTFCYSCMDVYYLGDKSAPIKVNGYDLLMFSSECGNVDFVPSQYNVAESSNKITIYLKHYFDTGNYILYTDSFKIKKDSGNFTIDNVLFMYRGIKQSSRQTKQIKQSIYQVNANEIVFVSFDVYSSKNWEENLMILPCNYIMCNDKPLITDTLRINLK